jgi:2TM domain
MELIMKNIEDPIAVQELEKLASKRVKKIKNFYIHAFIYASVLCVYILKNYYGFPFNFVPLEYINFFVMAIWTFIFVTDGIDLFLTEIVFGKKWESSKIKRMTEKENQKQTWE